METLFIEKEEFTEDMSRLKHGKAMARIVTRLGSFCEAHGTGEVYIEPDVFLPNQNRKVIPDIAFIAKDNVGIIDENDIFEGAPDLIIEIISPSTYLFDLDKKKQLYALSGVKEYWLIFAEAKIIQVYTRSDAGRYELLKVAGEKDKVFSNVLPGFEVNVSETLKD